LYYGKEGKLIDEKGASADEDVSSIVLEENVTWSWTNVVCWCTFPLQTFLTFLSSPWSQLQKMFKVFDMLGDMDAKLVQEESLLQVSSRKYAFAYPYFL
jgi:hypothetical protein